jgi:hypothetical protein
LVITSVIRYVKAPFLGGLSVKMVLFFLMLIPFSQAAPLLDRPWDGISDPLIMSSSFERKLHLLPLTGKVKKKNTLWSGHYWPLKQGNINYRWFAENRLAFNYHSPNLSEAKRLSLRDLAELSPAEKYDLFIGRYDYPLKNEVNLLANPKAQIWEGICHGWAPASMNHEEPRPKVMRNQDGLEIPFGSTDIKALLSYYYAYGFNVRSTYQMGLRCDDGRVLHQDKNCDEDLNAGAFHIVLANRVGIDGISFIADIERWKEVWNNPVYSYQTVILKQGIKPDASAAPGTAHVVRLKTRFYYVDGGENSWQTVLQTPLQVVKHLDYEYELDIDSTGRIIGGEWKSKERPDFLWLKERPKRFEGILKRLEELLHDV